MEANCDPSRRTLQLKQGGRSHRRLGSVKPALQRGTLRAGFEHRPELRLIGGNEAARSLPEKGPSRQAEVYRPRDTQGARRLVRPLRRIRDLTEFDLAIAGSLRPAFNVPGSGQVVAFRAIA